MKAIKILAVIAVIAVLSTTEVAVMFWLGGKDVRRFCDEVKPGIPVAQLAELAKKHNVRFMLPGPREDSGAYVTIVNTPRSFGRHICTVRHDNVRVLESRYAFAD